MLLDILKYVTYTTGKKMLLAICFYDAKTPKCICRRQSTLQFATQKFIQCISDVAKFVTRNDKVANFIIIYESNETIFAIQSETMCDICFVTYLVCR